MLAFVNRMKGQFITMALLQISAFLLLGAFVTTGSVISDEERLMNHLFRGYNPSARPVLNSSSTVNVNLRFSLLQIQDLDVRNQILTTTGLLILEWVDERLAWTDALSDLDEVVVHGGNIWRPEFAVINGAESIYGEYTEFQATIKSDGSIRWEPGGVFKTMCNIDITYYPFDEQVCDLVFGSWSYYTTKMNLSTTTMKIHLDTYELNGEWEIIETAAVRNEFHFECCPHQRFSNIGFRLELRRRHTFYIMNVILPGILTSAVLLSIFYCIPSQKVHIGVAALLSYRLFMVNVADTIPRTSDHVPLLGIYLTCTMAITTLAMLATVLVGNLYETKDKPVPEWAKKVFFVYVDRLLCLCRFSQSTTAGSQVHAGMNGETSENGSTANDVQLDRFRVVTLLNPVAFKGQEPLSMDEEGWLKDGQRSTEGQRSRLDSPSAKFMSRFRQSVVQAEDRRPEVTDSKPNYKKDWMEVAAVCDRFFFWLCLVFILVTTAILFHPLAMSSQITIDEH